MPTSYLAYNIAHELSLSQAAVRQIIERYLSDCRVDLVSGSVIRFVGLVSLVPTPILSEHVKTSAYYCREVSKETGYPYFTVQRVIKGYFSRVCDGLFNGEPITLKGLCTLVPVVEEGEPVRVYSKVSRTFKRDLPLINSGVSSIRAHSCKLLKYSARLRVGKQHESLEANV